MRKVSLPEHITGKLVLHSMPGTKETWSDFILQIQKERVELILSLTSLEEIKEQSSDYADAIVNKTLLIKRIEFEIRDYGIPRDIEAFKLCINKIANSLIKGRVILIHCLGGIGRTGLAACCILQTLGLGRTDAQGRVKQSGSDVETQEQRNFITNFL